MQCNMCNKEAKVIALVEGVELSVCNDCGKFGNIIKPIRKESKETPKTIKIEKEKEIIELIANNYGEMIKKKRESLGLTQKELANKLAEKESLIHNIESERFEPNIELAKKFERFLGITLIEKQQEERLNKEKKETRELTLGDLIKKKD